MDTLLPYPENEASAYSYSDHLGHPLLGLFVPLAAAVLSLLVTIAIYQRMA